MANGKPGIARSGAKHPSPPATCMDEHCQIYWLLQQVDVDPAEEGFLRPLAFDDRAHVLLSEELKHLYTALTRAKNNIVIFDRNTEKRAPFYHWLRRLGMARVVLG